VTYSALWVGRSTQIIYLEADLQSFRAGLHYSETHRPRKILSEDTRLAGILDLGALAWRRSECLIL
jgi:hypothetical protein